jgi:hypothetical protein
MSAGQNVGAFFFFAREIRSRSESFEILWTERSFLIRFHQQQKRRTPLLVVQGLTALG